MAEGFRSQDVGLRAQKKVLSRMANNRTLVKSVIDATTGQLLDNLHKLAKNQCGSKKEADKVTKNIIKIVVKTGVLYRNEQFSAAELKRAGQFVKKFQSLAMSIISFYEVDFSYDRNYMMSHLNECKTMLKALVEPHLTEKSLNRIDFVFNFFSDQNFLDTLFRKDSPHRELLGKIVADLHKAMDEGEL